MSRSLTVHANCWRKYESISISETLGDPPRRSNGAFSVGSPIDIFRLGMIKPPCILIADDNETNRLIIATRLGIQGYQLFEAADGEEALEAARRRRPDLILLDVIMPKIDGFEVCRR